MWAVVKPVSSSLLITRHFGASFVYRKDLRILYLLTRDVNGFVVNNPRSRFPAARVRGGTLVCHVVVRLRQESVKGNMPQVGRLT